MTTVITPALGAGIAFTQGGTGASPGYAAVDDRRAGGVGPIQEGVYGATDYMVTQRAAGANLSVDISAANSSAVVQGDAVTGQGMYAIGPHPTAINETIATPDATNPRVDIVILEIQDNQHDASGANQARVRVITGTPTGGTTLNTRVGAPALPASALLLADVLVGAGVGTIPNTVIRDRRKFARGFCYQLAPGAFGTSAGSFSDVASWRAECSGVPLRVALMAAATCTAASKLINIQLTEDAVSKGRRDVRTDGTIAKVAVLAAMWEYTPAAGSHLLKAQFASDDGASTVTLGDNFLIAMEIVRQNVPNNNVTSG